MWKTSIGLRTLEGIEAEFYLEAVQLAVDYLELYAEAKEEIHVFTYDRTFDSASFEQKVVLLHRCLAALLDSTVEAPMLTNTIEAAAYFPFVYICTQVEEEINLEDTEFQDEPDNVKYSYRQMLWKPFTAYILQAWQESDESPEVKESENYEPIVYDVRSKDVFFWEEIIDELVDRIFWDRDWQLTFTNPQILDGIDLAIGEPIDLTDDYITNRLPKVSPEQAREALTAIKKWGSQ